MKSLKLAALAGAAVLALAACGERRDANVAADAGTADETAGTAGTATATAAFPGGARIVEEQGVTYRIDADGTRVRLGPADSRIVVEGDTRFRVDPDGTRVRIGPDGAAIELRGGEVDARVTTDGPTLEVNTSR